MPASRLGRRPPEPSGGTAGLHSVVVDQPGGSGRVLVTDAHRHDQPVVLALHGWTATSSLNWGRTAERLGNKYRFVIPDLRGHGQGPRGEFSLQACVNDAVTVCQQLGHRRFVVAGYSMGGALAQILARDHPELVDGLVLCATATHFVEGPGEQAVMAAAGLAAQVGNWVTPDRRRRFVELAVARRYGGASAVAKEVADHDLLAVLAAGGEIGKFDSRHWVGTLEAPAAIVATAADSVIDTNRQLRLARALPGARLEVVSGGHSACMVRPDEFIDAFDRSVHHVLR